MEAEKVGLEIIAVSDHFQPWRHHGGHAPAAMTWLGALAEATNDAILATSVLTPTLRYHLVDRRPVLRHPRAARAGPGDPRIGSGEAMNETPATGEEFPAERSGELRLAESVKLIRQLWTEERVTFEGEYYRTSNATIYDKPDEPVPIYLAASGPLAAKLCGRVGDGFICTSGKNPELYETLIENLEEGAAKVERDAGRSAG